MNEKEFNLQVLAKLVEIAKVIFAKLTGHKFGEPAKVEPVHEEEHEDYPPEPYNKEKSENVATSYERFQDRTI